MSAKTRSPPSDAFIGAAALALVAWSGTAGSALAHESANSSASGAEAPDQPAAEPAQGSANEAADIARKYLSDIDAPIAATKPAPAAPDAPIATAAPAARSYEARAVEVAQEAPDETLADAIRDVVQNNPDILEAQARRDDARFARSQARAAYLPSVDLMTSTGPERSRSRAPSDYSDQDRIEQQATLRQLVFDFGQTSNDIRRAGRLVEGADWALKGAVEAVGLDVVAAYLGVLEKQQLLDLARENFAAHLKILETVTAQRQYGIGSGADVSRVEARMNAAKALILDRESDLAAAREAYRRQLDRLPGRLAPAPLAEPLLPVDEAMTLRAAQDSNPELRQARAQVEALRRQRAAQLGSYLPRIEFEAQRNWRKNVGGATGLGDDERAMLTFRYKLFDGGAREAAYGRIGARLRTAYSAYDRTRRDVEQRVRTEFAALAAAREKVAAIDAEVDAGRRLVSLYMEQFRSGGRSVFDLLDSQETLIEAKGKRIANVTAREVSAYRVLASMGKLFEVVTGAAYPARDNQYWWGQSIDARLPGERRWVERVPHED
ncbi:MAG: hypothetical protein EBZ50_01685 [Alphaproteobacteria bacterium]|nr:hypothetical protein [Alphaproteobacteria bacterium]